MALTTSSDDALNVDGMTSLLGDFATQVKSEPINGDSSCNAKSNFFLAEGVQDLVRVSSFEFCSTKSSFFLGNNVSADKAFSLSWRIDKGEVLDPCNVITLLSHEPVDGDGGTGGGVGVGDTIFE